MITTLDEIEKLIKELKDKLNNLVEVKSRLLQEITMYESVMTQIKYAIKRIDDYITENTKEAITINLALTSGGYLEFINSRKLPTFYWDSFEKLVTITQVEKQIQGKNQADFLKKNLLDSLELEKNKKNKNKESINIIEQDNIIIKKRLKYLVGQKNKILLDSEMKNFKDRINKLNRSDQELIKCYITACINLNLSKMPSSRQLEEISSPGKSSWQRKLSDIIFLTSLYKGIGKKLAHKNLRQDKKDNLIKIYIEIDNKIERISFKKYKNKSPRYRE